MKSTNLSNWQRLAPVATLLMLSPLLAEVMFGSTHLTTLFLLIPQICIYGSATLIIRDLVRRRHRNWLAILLLGIAYAILEECVILQTSVSPVLFGGDPTHIYGWAFGVSWVYLLWALVYESVWAIALPIQLTELIFPDRRSEPWVGKRGLTFAAIAFIVASAIVWYQFTQVGITSGGAFEAPLPVVLIALAAAVALGIAAFSSWTSKPIARAANANRHIPSRGVAGLVAFVLSLVWFILPILVFVGPVPFSAVIPIGIGVAWAAGALLLINWWMGSPAWQDDQRLSLIIGALMASMLAGFLESGIQLPVDLVGKLVFNVVAVVMLIYLAGRIHHRTIQSGD